MKKGIKRTRSNRTYTSSTNHSKSVIKRPSSNYRKSIKSYKEKKPLSNEQKLNLITNGAIILTMLIVMIVFYFIFGILAAGLLFFGTFIICAVHLLLSNNKRSRRKRRIINGIFI